AQPAPAPGQNARGRVPAVAVRSAGPGFRADRPAQPGPAPGTPVDRGRKADEARGRGPAAPVARGRRGPRVRRGRLSRPLAGDAARLSARSLALVPAARGREYDDAPRCGASPGKPGGALSA